MPTWGELLQELAHLKGEGPSPHDVLRRKYLHKLSEHTGRAAIVYATCWLEGRPGVNGDHLSLTLGDKQGFMEAVSNITERELDLILTSPGGDPDAAGSIMEYLRTRFDQSRRRSPTDNSAAQPSGRTRRTEGSSPQRSHQTKRPRHTAATMP